jgi:hypothetical protein
MQKFKMIASICFAVYMMTACKKETQNKFSAIGYWRGNIYISNAALLNRPDGTCRLYHDIKLNDTADAAKGEGTYEVTGSSYKAEIFDGNNLVMILISETTDPDKMTGRTLLQQFAYDFKFQKQP